MVNVFVIIIVQARVVSKNVEGMRYLMVSDGRFRYFGFFACEFGDVYKDARISGFKREFRG